MSHSSHPSASNLHMERQDMEKQNVPGKPWYREFWAWFVVTPIIIVILVCSFTVSLAFIYGDDVVHDDYYKQGKMVNQSFDAIRLAKDLGISSQVTFDFVSGEIVAELKSVSNLKGQDVNTGKMHPLYLSLSHPMNEKKDQQITLKPVGVHRFRADIGQVLSGRWYIKLMGVHDGASWRLQSEVDFLNAHDFLLVPQK